MRGGIHADTYGTAAPVPSHHKASVHLYMVMLCLPLCGLFQAAEFKTAVRSRKSAAAVRGHGAECCGGGQVIMEGRILVDGIKQSNPLTMFPQRALKSSQRCSCVAVLQRHAIVRSA